MFEISAIDRQEISFDKTIAGDVTTRLNTELWIFVFALVSSLLLQLLSTLSATYSAKQLEDHLDCGQLGDQVDTFTQEDIVQMLNTKFTDLPQSFDHIPD